MSDDFPYLVDRISLTANWSLHLPFVCQVRIEDEATVFWRSRFTIWITAHGNEAGMSVADRKAYFAEHASKDKFDVREYKQGQRLYYSYRLAEESEDKRLPALYAFSFAKDGHLQLSFYFDNEEDVESAYEILKSVNSDSAAIEDTSIYSQFGFVTKLVMENEQPVAFMYREEPDSDEDSGWRFFSGRESQEYVDDPSNIQLLPVAFVAQLTPDIIPHLLAPVGSQLERRGKKFVSV